jgi:hypothetical protein
MGHQEKIVDVTWFRQDGFQIPTTENQPLFLAGGTSYMADLGGEAGTVTSLHLQWDAVISGNYHIASSNFPDANVFNSQDTAGAFGGPYWFFEPMTGSVSIPGGTAGNDMRHFSWSGALRLRVHLGVVTGGLIRARTHHKSARTK